MRSLLAFIKKELLEGVRSGKIFIMMGMFVLFGFMNPGIAAITPWLMDMLSESIAATGMQIGAVTVSAVDSWAQFFKNMQMALITFLLVYGSVFTKEYGSTLVLVLTKGLARYKIVVAKLINMLFVWTVGYWLCYGITYIVNAIVWDNSVVPGILTSAVLWWLFGVWCIALVVMFSTIFNGYIGVLLGTGGAVFLCYLISIIPKADKVVPTALMNVYGIMLGTEQVSELAWAIAITAVTTVAMIAASFPLMNKREV